MRATVGCCALQRCIRITFVIGSDA